MFFNSIEKCSLLIVDALISHFFFISSGIRSNLKQNCRWPEYKTWHWRLSLYFLHSNLSGSKKITQVNFSKGSILDVWQGSEYTSKWWKVCFHFSISKPCTLMQKKVHGDHIPILFFFAKPLNWYKNLYKYTLLYSCLITVSLPLLLSFSMGKNTIFQLFFW